MDVPTRELLRTILAACELIGSANSLEDRGGRAEAEAMRERAGQTIGEALAAASEEDRGRIDALFGPEVRRRFNQLSWATDEEYIRFLLEHDPELPAVELKERQGRIVGRLSELGARPADARFDVRYTKPFSPSMLTPFLELVGRNGDRPGWYGIGEVLHHLNLSGEGLVDDYRPGQPARYAALIEGVSIHVTMERAAARTSVAVLLRSDDGGALRRVERAVREALARHGWEEVAAPLP